ncbi:hypothetical protein BD311DRAFT_800921 [Dichomitus squalens]|uniref:Nephrocystin 3-like N-terminal domain-containing protein n=1 Tax=Dichomitus squalens TaxID=114155 RepID=A0A4Q9M766_9APHY|nr:hypothetical protein BD311DRAFT_800921 [Dichomitus squalens]
MGLMSSTNPFSRIPSLGLMPGMECLARLSVSDSSDWEYFAQAGTGLDRLVAHHILAAPFRLSSGPYDYHCMLSGCLQRIAIFRFYPSEECSETRSPSQPRGPAHCVRWLSVFCQANSAQYIRALQYVLRLHSQTIMCKFKSRLGKRLKRCFRRSSNDAEAVSTIPGPPDIVEPENCAAEGLRKDISFEETQDAAPETVRAEDVAKIATAIDTGSTALTSLSSDHRIVTIGATAIEPTGEDVESAYELWKPVLENVESFASLIEAIGDLHPYAKIASRVLLSVVKPVIDQDNRDNAMADLLEAMNELYGLVNKTGRLSDLDEYRKKLLKDMSSKTEECAKFIQDEARFTNFWIRTGSNVITGSRVDEKVREFTEAFVDLRRSFTEVGVLETEIRVANLADSSKIDNLTHVRGAGLDSGRACLEGTRVKTLGALRDWINNPNPDAPRVLFLLGGAGTGKSSIAHSIGVHLEARRRLGAFFSFNRTFQAERPPKYVFSTIAHDLANWDPTFRHALADDQLTSRSSGRGL